jgi:hypothetical protein
VKLSFGSPSNTLDNIIGGSLALDVIPFIEKQLLKPLFSIIANVAGKFIVLMLLQ